MCGLYPHVHVCYGACVNITEQVMEVSSLPLTCGPWRSNSGHYSLILLYELLLYRHICQSMCSLQRRLFTKCMPSLDCELLEISHLHLLPWHHAGKTGSMHTHQMERANDGMSNTANLRDISSRENWKPDGCFINAPLILKLSTWELLGVWTNGLIPTQLNV